MSKGCVLPSALPLHANSLHSPLWEYKVTGFFLWAASCPWDHHRFYLPLIRLMQPVGWLRKSWNWGEIEIMGGCPGLRVCPNTVRSVRDAAEWANSVLKWEEPWARSKKCEIQTRLGSLWPWMASGQGRGLIPVHSSLELTQIIHRVVAQ